jgi:hypothetical protein
VSVEYFRKLMIVGRDLRKGERGPLFASSQSFDLVPIARGTPTNTWCVIYWFWVPPDKRVRCSNKSRVTDARTFELQALAEGTLEEWWANVRMPAGMSTREATLLLKADYDRRVVRRFGFLPDALQRAPAVVEVGTAARAVEQERGRIVL